MNMALLIIIIAELLGASLWFSANGAMAGIQKQWGLGHAELGYLTSAIQLGFICGTIILALSALADRFAASRIFAIAAVAGAISNALLVMANGDLQLMLVLRFITGMTLAGIYPIGMKLVVGWAPDKKALVLGWLVGMLTLGTALPHLIGGFVDQNNWHWVIYSASCLALIAAVSIYYLGDGPHSNITGKIRWGAVLAAFKHADFRAAALGYFGHMWELYAFWTLVPLLLAVILQSTGDESRQIVSLLSFFIIGIGALGCILGGYISKKIGSARVATLALIGSGLMCLLFPFLQTLPVELLIALMLIWGMLVVADSPQFSALAAHTSPSQYVGSALSIMNSIGFLITILTIELTTTLFADMQNRIIWLLLPGPIFGVFAMLRLVRKRL